MRNTDLVGGTIIVTSESGGIPEAFYVACALKVNMTLSTFLSKFDPAQKEVLASYFQLKLKKTIIIVILSRIIRETEK